MRRRQAQIRSEQRPDILLIVGSAAAIVWLVAGCGRNRNNRPVSL